MTPPRDVSRGGGGRATGQAAAAAVAAAPEISMGEGRRRTNDRGWGDVDSRPTKASDDDGLAAY
jgi:hypothetical protein